MLSKTGLVHSRILFTNPLYLLTYKYYLGERVADLSLIWPEKPFHTTVICEMCDIELYVLIYGLTYIHV